MSSGGVIRQTTPLLCLQDRKMRGKSRKDIKHSNRRLEDERKGRWPEQSPLLTGEKRGGLSPSESRTEKHEKEPTRIERKYQRVVMTRRGEIAKVGCQSKTSEARLVDAARGEKEEELERRRRSCNLVSESGCLGSLKGAASGGGRLLETTFWRSQNGYAVSSG